MFLTIAHLVVGGIPDGIVQELPPHGVAVDGAEGDGWRLQGLPPLLCLLHCYL